jgi:hypothetical protein
LFGFRSRAQLNKWFDKPTLRKLIAPRRHLWHRPSGFSRAPVMVAGDRGNVGGDPCRRAYRCPSGSGRRRLRL